MNGAGKSREIKDIASGGAVQRKPWLTPRVVHGTGLEDSANSYQLHQDSNPHASNDAS
ncbi:MAG: hypothetical protein WDM91_07460 [Rhizomicrobium sp.]